MPEQLENLEALISKISYEIVSEGILEENEINKLLGVLASNGVNAMWVYALDKIERSFKTDKNNVCKLLMPNLFNFIFKLNSIHIQILNDEQHKEQVNEIEKIRNSIKEKMDTYSSELCKKIEDINGKDISDNEKNKIIKKLQSFYIKKLSQEFDRNFQEVVSNFFQNLSNDLHKLLFLKQLLEKTLIYARYHAKALGD